MKFAVPVTRNYKPDEISLRFSRSLFFLIIDKTKMEFSIIANPFAVSGERQLSSEVIAMLAELGVQYIMAYELGFNARKIADKYGMQLILLPGILNTLSQLFEQMKLNNITEVLSDI